MNRDAKLLKRKHYTALDWLSDIGGIQGLLWSGISLLLTKLDPNFFDDFMISRAYKYKEPTSRQADSREKGY